MARIARPTTSAFGHLIRTRRVELCLSKDDLATQLGFSASFIDVLETGRRGCDLDDLPRIAATLGLDQRDLARVYLAEKHPEFCRALFGDTALDEVRQVSGMPVEDTHWRLDQLPRRERGIVEALIEMLYSLGQRAGERRHRNNFVLPADRPLHLGPRAHLFTGQGAKDGPDANS